MPGYGGNAARNPSAWTVRNTFVEMAGGGGDSDPELRRSHSDSSLFSKSSNSEGRTPLILGGPSSSAIEQSGSKKEKKESSSSGSIRKGTDGAHLTWMSSSSDQDESATRARREWDENFQEQDQCDENDLMDGFDDFDIDESLIVHQTISNLCAEGTDLREVLRTNFAGVDIKQYVPREPLSGELLSLGSVLHLIGECKRCSFWVKNTCHKGETCLYCHFPHTEQIKCRRASKKTRMRLREKGVWKGDQPSGDLDAAGGEASGDLDVTYQGVGSARDSQASHAAIGISSGPNQPYDYKPPLPLRISL